MSLSVCPPVAGCTARPLDRHPFLATSAPGGLVKVYDILLNGHALAIEFPSWLAGVIARLDDRRIQSLLARQLNDELGEGDPTRVHLVLYERALAVLARFRPALPAAQATAPGARLRHAAQRWLCAPDPYEALGAVMAGEVHGCQFLAWLGDQLAHQTAIDPRALEWFTAHETAELGHANDAARIGELIADRPERREAAARGAQGMSGALASFLDDLQARHEAARP